MGKFEKFERPYGKKKVIKYYWRLKARNGEIIAASQAYESPETRDKGIRSVRFNAPFATTVDVEK